ncbi:hypothetical protein ACLI09_10355 [Flavobacterium sp. RHBU_24]|uniref:hypothetical protein n=1 Tax=Flavobacterium sp. RHBU_24 TaxID=3391185 RepID=UPI0039847D5D
MKNKIVCLLLCLLPILGIAQTRQLLRGHLVSDSLQVENLSVENLSAKTKTVTDTRGNFLMYARVGDTLHFDGMQFRSTRLKLTEDDLRQNPLTVHLDVNVTVLDEVLINPLTGELGRDAKKTKVKPLNPDVDDSEFIAYPASKRPVNGALPVTESQLQGVDFIAIGKMIFKPKKKKTDKGEIYNNTVSKTFSEAAVTRYTDYFFTETLQIPPADIALFLGYCDGPEVRKLLDPRKEFELTDYLVKKAKEYKEQKK